MRLQIFAVAVLFVAASGTYLPDFDIGTLPKGEDIVHNGQPSNHNWDPILRFAAATVKKSTMYISFNQRASNDELTFQISKMAAVPGQDDAGCTAAYTLSTSTIKVNVSSVMDITYSCTRPGQSVIAAEITFLGKFSKFEAVPISWTRTYGNALDVGTTPNGTDVVHIGATQRAFRTKPTFAVRFDEAQTMFFLRLHPGLVGGVSHKEEPKNDIIPNQSPEHVVAVSFDGALVHSKFINHNSTQLIVKWEKCKILTVTTVTVQLDMHPFAPVSFSWKKFCVTSANFNIREETAGFDRPIVTNGLNDHHWMAQHYFSTHVHQTVLKITNTNPNPKKSIDYKGMVLKVTSGASVCDPVIGGNGTESTVLQPYQLAKATLVVVLNYTCGHDTDGQTNMTFTVNLGQFSPLQFNMTKYNNNRPGLGVTLMESDGVIQPSDVGNVVVKGHTQANWILGAAAPVTLSADAVYLRFSASVAGPPFVLAKGLDVSLALHHNPGQCDPHVRSVLTQDGSRIGAQEVSVEVTLWCKYQTSKTEGMSQVIVTIPDLYEYETTQFGFHKAVLPQQSFKIYHGHDIVFSGGSAHSDWSQRGKTSLSTSADAVFSLSGAHMPKLGTPRVYPNSSLCRPTASVRGDKVTVKYNCTELLGREHATDMILILPIEGASPAMLHWIANTPAAVITTTTTTAAPQSAASAVPIALGVGSTVVVLLAIILVVEFLRRRKAKDDELSRFDTERDVLEGDSLTAPLVDPVETETASETGQPCVRV